jgi:DNA-binding MarR family transcriptional regulator
LERGIAQDGEDRGPDVALVEAEFTRLWASWECAVEEIGGTVPPGRLAAAMGISLSGASRLYDRMAAAGLLRCEPAAGTRPEVTLAPTIAGQRLAGWIRGRRRAVLAHALGSMSADGRQALVRGLGELAARQGTPKRDSTFPRPHMQQGGTDLARRL